MDLQLFDAFVAVAETGSFSRAADNLHLSQPAISKRIAALESFLNTSLFDRIGHNTSLTESGRTLLPYSRRILWEMENSRRALSRLSGRVAGRLSLGTSHHIGLHRLPHILRTFNRLYPEVDLDLRFQDSEQACADVERGELEVAMVTLPPDRRPRLNALEAWLDPLSIVVTPQHTLARETVTPVSALAGYCAILPDVGTYTRSLVDDALAQAGASPTRILVSNYMETIRMLVSIGFGWSALPRTLVDDQLTELDFPELQITRRLGAVWHSQRSLSNAAQALLERVSEASR